MKKNIFKSMLALALLAVFAAPVFATDATNDAWNDPVDVANDKAITDDTGTVGPGLSGEDLKFSANVIYAYVSDTTAGNYFALATYNMKGTKAYASNSASSKIYATVDEIKDITAGTDPIAVSSIETGSAWATATWSEVGK